MNPQAVLEGVKAALAGIDRLNVSDHVPSVVTPPHAIVGFGPFTYTDMGDSLDLSVNVTVFTSRADDKSGQHRLAEFIDPTGDHSIKAAIDASPGLPVDDEPTCDTAVVTGGDEIGVADVAGTQYHALTFNVSVLG